MSVFLSYYFAKSVVTFVKTGRAFRPPSWCFEDRHVPFSAFRVASGMAQSVHMLRPQTLQWTSASHVEGPWFSIHLNVKYSSIQLFCFLLTANISICQYSTVNCQFSTCQLSYANYSMDGKNVYRPIYLQWGRYQESWSFSLSFQSSFQTSTTKTQKKFKP